MTKRLVLACWLVSLLALSSRPADATVCAHTGSAGSAVYTCPDTGITTTNGLNLQDTINAASYGDTINLSPGVIYEAALTLPSHGTPAVGQYLTIQSSSASTISTTATMQTFSNGATVRVVLWPPRDIAKLATLRAPATGLPAVLARAAVMGYQFIGLEIVDHDSVSTNTPVLFQWGESGTGPNGLPTYAELQATGQVIVDRCFVHSSTINASDLLNQTYTVTGAQTAFQLEGLNVTVENSYIAGFRGHIVGTTANAQTYGILMQSGPGPLTITDNYIEAGFDNIFLGGRGTLTNHTATLSGGATATSATFSNVTGLNVNDYVSFQTPTQTISAASNANPVRFTVPTSTAPVGYTFSPGGGITISGFTGAWAVVNGTYYKSSGTNQYPSWVDATHFDLLGVNTTSLGAVTGSPVYVINAESAGKVTNISGTTVTYAMIGPQGLVVPPTTPGQASWGGQQISNVTIQRNELNKWTFWQTIGLTDVKMYIEWKYGVNSLIEGNVFGIMGTSTGGLSIDGTSSVGFTIHNQGNSPWIKADSVTVQNNLMHGAGWIAMHLIDTETTVTPGGNLTISNNLWTRDPSIGSPSGGWLQTGGGSTYTVSHNTVRNTLAQWTTLRNLADFSQGTPLYGQDLGFANLTIQNNLFYGNGELNGGGTIVGDYPPAGPVDNAGQVVINRLFTTVFPLSTPVANDAAVGFVNVTGADNGGDYHGYALATTSPFKGHASDGTDPGVNFGALDAALGFSAGTFTLTLTPAGTGSGTLSGAGAYAAGAVVTLTATPAVGSTFTGWSGLSPCPQNAATPTTLVMPSGNLTCTGTFAVLPPTFTLTLSPTGAGNGTTTGGGMYTAGTVVTITATPTGTSTFTTWGGPAPCPATNTTPTTITMPANNLTCTASFATAQPTQVTLTLLTAGTGSGTVTGAGTYTSGASATVSATASSGSTFSGWSGPSPCPTGTTSPQTITLGSTNLTCSATFTIIPPPPTFLLTLTATGTGTGTTTGGGQYAAGTVVTVTATPTGGSTFTTWGGGGACPSTATTPTTLTMPASTLACTAQFTGAPPTQVNLTVATLGTGSGTVTGTGIYTAGASATLSATPTSGSSFTGWSGPSPCPTGTTSPVTITLGSTDLACGATFTAIPPPLFVLTIATAGAGNGTTTGAGSYTAGTLVTLTATPSGTSTFTGWSGPAPCPSSTTSPADLVMPANNLACTATFAVAQPTQVTLVLLSAGTGTGTVTGGGTYLANASVTLTATPTAGSSFSGWSGASPCPSGTTTPVTITLGTTNLACTGTFNLNPPPTFTLTLVTQGTGNGSVSGGGTYAGGASVVLTATPDSASQFAGWSGASPCPGGTITPITIVMPSSALVCTATFVPLPVGTGLTTGPITQVNCPGVMVSQFPRSLGDQALTVSSTPVSPTVPAGTVFATANVQNNPVRVRGDGGPLTTSTGQTWPPNSHFLVCGGGIGALQLMRQSNKDAVVYFSFYGP